MKQLKKVRNKHNKVCVDLEKKAIKMARKIY